MAFLELRNVCKSYGEGHARVDVLRDINLSVEEGEFVAIVGFSGSGKSTLISAVAGLIEPDAGEILVKGEPVRGASPDRGVVFQNYSLMPWLTVEGNIALAVDAVFKRWPREKRRAQVHKYIEMVGLSHATDRRPGELSGGMRQRVSVARALATMPEILLLDEPLSALDALTRANLQDEIEAISQRERKTIILITNDVDEAVLLADRVIPLNPGPNATFGPSFNVDMARPRDRSTLNENPDFIRLRRDITAYLMQVGIESSGEQDGELTLPNVVPVTSRDYLPKAARDAEKSQTSHPERYVEFSEVTKIYPTPNGPLTVVDKFDLRIAKGEFVSVIGHSGCGKSTVLSMVAGLNEISGGGIILDMHEIDGAGPDRGVVFQSPSLFPWLSASDNVALGVEKVYPHATQRDRDDIVRYYLSRVGLRHAYDTPVSDMSNGMKQRVGIARAFALSPKLLLLDEPFGMLDSLTRWELQEVLMDVWARKEVTAICVTHDVDEAILLADRVIMMTNGPNARIGEIMKVDLPRPRSRKALLAHPDYYRYRQQLLTFLADYEHGDPKPKPDEAETPIAMAVPL